LANNLFGSCQDDDGAAVARLSAGEIPNVRAIAACLRRQKASLSNACRAVFEQ
jgi:hypothetical protein